jgi:hypothetical protein
MRKSLLITAILLFAILGTPAFSRADITYIVNQNVGTGSITGVIVTNGTLGQLNSIDIDSWDFGASLSPGSGESDHAGSTPSVSEIGDGLSATSDTLSFNFDLPEQSNLIFSDASNGFEWCLFTFEGCDPAGSGELLSVGGESVTSTGLSGDQVIGTAAPEPGTAVLLLAGIVSMILIRRRLAQLLGRTGPAAH